jgi:hypothetical protein
LDRKWTNIIIWPRDRASILVQQLRINFIQHCFCDLGSHFEALESVLLIFFLGFASKKYDQTDSRAPKCLPRVTKTVMYIVKIRVRVDTKNSFNKYMLMLMFILFYF